jgi:RNA polymerase sigma factor (sigma-70 family)
MLMENTPKDRKTKSYHHLAASLQNRSFNDCKSLVKRICAGDPVAEHLLAKRYQSHIEHLGRLLGADRVLREDLAQEVMLKVILNLRANRLNDASKLRAYIDQTTRFTYYGWQRNKNSKLEFMPSCDDEQAESGNTVEEAYEQSQNRAWLTEQIDKLNVYRDKQLLLRFYLDHRDKCEVCAELDVTDVQFDKLIHRAKQRLRRIADA